MLSSINFFSSQAPITPVPPVTSTFSPDKFCGDAVTKFSMELNLNPTLTLIDVALVMYP